MSRHDTVSTGRKPYPKNRKPRPSIAVPIEERFWKYVQKSVDPDGCWLWTGGKYEKGYGQTSEYIDGKCVKKVAHRLSWEIHNGPIPDGLFACHNCPTGDNPACVNPAHLFLGTQADNMRDMAEKNRSAHGEKSAAAILTEDDVREIRRLYIPRKYGMPRLASEFSTSLTNIWHIIHGDSWKRLLEEDS